MGGDKGKFDSVFGPTRLENKLKAAQNKRTLAERLLGRASRTEQPIALAEADVAPAAVNLQQPNDVLPEKAPHVEARYGRASIAILDRGVTDQRLFPEPWLARTIDAALVATTNREIRLELIWPGTIKSVALVHALASLERMAIGDKRGLRALMFPTKRTSFAPLSKFLFEREKLLDWGQQYLTVTALQGAKPPLPGRDDQNKDMLLQAVRSAWNQERNLPAPCISEVMPHFDWSLESGEWGNYATRYLSRTKRALQRAYKRELWKSDRFAQLGDPLTAPDALFGISHLATAKQWKAALSSKALENSSQPELVLFDLTRSIRDSTQRNLIRLVPEVIAAVRETWRAPVGFLIVTDEPKTYFVLRARLLEQLGDDAPRFVANPVVATANDYGLAEVPRPLEWSPLAVSNKHFHVEVLDHEMADAATRLWTVGQGFDQDSEPQRQLNSAAAFLLRLANLPGGYKDYVAWMEASTFADSIRTEMTWNGHVAKLNRVLEYGGFADKSEAVRRAIAKASTLVDSCYEQTPLAARITKEVGRCVGKQKYRLAMVFRSNGDIAVAKAFLQRQRTIANGASYENVAHRVEFFIHKELEAILDAGTVPTKIVFVGLPDETLKELLSSERVPADSVVLIDWRRANTVLAGLRALKTVDAYKPYRGRISEFGDEIERRLKEVPNPIDVEKIDGLRVRRLSLSAAAAEASRRAEGAGGAYKLELENGSTVIVGHRVYLYDPDEEKPFHIEDTEKVQQGDLVFVMSDELKDMFEIALIRAGHGIARGSNFAEMLRNYHHDVLANSKQLFGEIGVGSLARKVQERMTALRPGGDVCSLSRIRYWLDVEGAAETQAEDLKPHSTWSKADFETFARALEIPENLISIYWLMVTGQRTALQQAGRELADRYAYVLFREEAAAIHFRLDQPTILALQDEAVRNTYRVLRVIPPEKRGDQSDRR